MNPLKIDKLQRIQNKIRRGIFLREAHARFKIRIDGMNAYETGFMDLGYLLREKYTTLHRLHPTEFWDKDKRQVEVELEIR